MSSTKSRDGPGGGGGGTNKSANKSNSNTKTDLKTDKIDLNPKVMPTAEQMQIARIIDTHRQEDPELQRKIRQVMDIARTTEDEACKALHSREYDIEQAITLLVEGDSQSEWEEARRKKKVKTPGQKAEAKAEKAEAAKNDRSGGSNRDRDSRPDRMDRGGGERKGDSENQDGDSAYRGRDAGGRGFRGGRGGRGGGRGGPYRVDNKENDELNGGGSRSGNGFGGRYSNGPGRGGRGGRESGPRGRGIGGNRDRDREGSSRTFASRARGPREGDGFSHHPIDVWENSQADAPTETLKVEKWDEFPSAEDWDNEEYTGSLAESKVFTPSTQTSAVTNSALTDTNSGSGPMKTETTASDGGGGHAPPPNHNPADLMSLFANAGGGGGKPKSSMSSSSYGSGGEHGHGGGVVAGQSLDLSLLQQKPNSANSGGGSDHSHPPPSALQLQQSYSNATQHGQLQMGTTEQPLPQRNKGARPTTRGPTTISKMPSGVEMPDDSSVATLDVQFGGMEFGSSGSAFNSVTQQHGIPAGGDMIYGGGGNSSSLDFGVGPASGGDKDSGVSGKSSNQVQSPPNTANSFQGQRNNQQQQQLAADALNSKSVAISPNIDAASHGHSHSQKGGSGPASGQPQSQQHSQQSQPSSYGNSAGAASSAFVSYAAKGAPGFPPVTQPQGQGSYGVGVPQPQGLSYGSATSNLILTQPPPNYHGISSYAAQPIQSHNIPSQQGLSQGVGVSSAGTYGVPPPQNPYQQNIPGSAYMYGSNQYGGYGQQQQGQKFQNSANASTGGQSGKDSGLESNSSTSSSTVPSGQIGTAGNLSAGSTNTSSSSSTPNSKMSGSGGGGVGVSGTTLGTSATSTSSKISAGSNVTSGTSGMPPGMMIHPQYIVNQGGVPLYGFQPQPLYGYDESSVQFLPRIAHPAMTSYYDPTGAAYSTVPGTGRNDGGSLQTYTPGTESRFTRSDSSTASPVPSNLSGQATAQQMYNPLQGYYYVGNNMIHPAGAYPYGPPQMYPTTPMQTPGNQSSAPPHASMANQYQGKGMYGSSYVSYDASQPQLGGDFGGSKQAYSGTSGVGGGGGSAGSNSGKGSAGSSVNTNSSQAIGTELTSALYKTHTSKLTSYDKPQYGGSTGAMYNNAMGQGNSMGGGGGMVFGGYIPAQPVLPPPLLLQEGNNGQRQGGGQPKPGKQFGNQQYWGSN